MPAFDFDDIARIRVAPIFELNTVAVTIDQPINVTNKTTVAQLAWCLQSDEPWQSYVPDWGAHWLSLQRVRMVVTDVRSNQWAYWVELHSAPGYEVARFGPLASLEEEYQTGFRNSDAGSDVLARSLRKLVRDSGRSWVKGMGILRQRKTTPPSPVGTIPRKQKPALTLE